MDEDIAGGVVLTGAVVVHVGTNHLPQIASQPHLLPQVVEEHVDLLKRVKDTHDATLMASAILRRSDR